MGTSKRTTEEGNNGNQEGNNGRGSQGNNGNQQENNGRGSQGIVDISKKTMEEGRSKESSYHIISSKENVSFNGQ